MSTANQPRIESATLGKNDDREKKDGEAASAKRKAEKLGLTSSVLTIAICGDEKTAKCASACQMQESWKHLRAVAKARRKADQPRIAVLKIECPGVCRFGPVTGVFPSGVWYGGCDPDTLDQIIQWHESPESINAPRKDDPALANRLD